MVVFLKLDGRISGSFNRLDVRSAHQLVHQVQVVEVARHGDGNRSLRIGYIDLQYRYEYIERVVPTVIQLAAIAHVVRGRLAPDERKRVCRRERFAAHFGKRYAGISEMGGKRCLHNGLFWRAAAG